MTAGPIQLWSQQHGDADDPAVVLISGLGQQSTAWPMGFVHGIVIGGYRVIRFDNRDVNIFALTLLPLTAARPHLKISASNEL